MKFGYCLTAFVIGCFFAVFIKANHSSGDVSIKTGLLPNPLLTISDSAPVGTTLDVTDEVFATTREGVEIRRFICRNRNGMSFEIIEYGATLTAVNVPDRDGNLANVVLSCEGLEGYQACSTHLGGTIGRFAGVIDDSRVLVDGQFQQLSVNDGVDHRDGGAEGFDRKIWSGQKIWSNNQEAVGVRMSLVSIYGDQGYPGNVEITIDFLLNNNNELSIDYSATTDASTPINLTTRNFWNLSGSRTSSVREHQMQLGSGETVACNKSNDLVKLPVDSQPLDFRSLASIENRLQFPTAAPANEHFFCLPETKGSEPVLAAVLLEPHSGRKLEVFTDQPVIRVSTGMEFNGQPSSGGFEAGAGIAIEPQGFPYVSPKADSMLKPGEVYNHRTIHRFSIDS